jgi:hypothetical protein
VSSYFRLRLQGEECKEPAFLVEVEVLVYEEGWGYGKEKSPNPYEFAYWISKRGVKKVISKREDGTIEIEFYTGGGKRTALKRPKKIFRIKPFKSYDFMKLQKEDGHLK